MLQPKFNPFFYSKYIFEGAPKENVDPIMDLPKGDTIDIPEVQASFDNASQIKLDQFKKAIESSVGGDKKDSFSKFLPTNVARLNRVDLFTKAISEKINAKNAEFENYIYSEKIQKADPKEQKRLIMSKLKELVTYVSGLKSSVDEFCECEKKRTELISALSAQSVQLKKYFKDYFDTKLSKEDQGKVVWEDLDKLIDAYMKRWVLENEKSISAISIDQVKSLHGTLSNGVFTNGVLKNDLDGRKRIIFNIINKYWKTGKEREVYKNGYWSKMDESWVSKGADKNGLVTYSYSRAKRKDPYLDEKYETGLVPLPDGKDLPKSWKEYESPLVDKSLKPSEDKKAAPKEAAKEAASDAQQKEVTPVLTERASLIAAFNKLGLTVDDLAKYQDQISKVAKDNGWSGEYPAKWILGNWSSKDQKPGYLPIMREEVAILKKAIESKEKDSPVVTSFNLDANGLHIVGKNLPEGAVNIDIESRPLSIASSKLGEGSVTISGDAIIDATQIIASNIKDGIVKHLRKNSPSFDTKNLPKGFDELAVNIAKEKVKKQMPKITVVGTASMDGSFEGNIQLAKARAESAKAKILAKYPGIHVETSYGVKGPDGIFKEKGNLQEKEKSLVSYWNTVVAKENQNLKVKDIQEIYAKIKTPSQNPSDAEKQFFAEFFDNARGASIKIEPAKDKQEFTVAMNFENSGQAPA